MIKTEQTHLQLAVISKFMIISFVGLRLSRIMYFKMIKIKLTLMATLAVFIVLLMPFFSTQKASATAYGSGFNVITSPLPIKITTTPGQTIHTQLRIKNQGSQPEGIKVGLMKFGASGNNGVPDLYALTAKDSYSKWVHFDPQVFVAQPGVWNDIDMTINVPQSAALGYYLAVTFSSTSISSNKGATNLNGEVASLILLNVQVPNEKPQINIVNFQTDHGLYEYLPANFNIRVHNGGNIFIAPVGNIFIQKGGKTIDTLDVNTAGGNVLPGTNRLFTTSWTNGFPLFKEKIVNDKPVRGANGLPEETLKWDFTQLSKFRFGRYTANVLVVYNDGKNDIPEQASLSFWVFPWKAMIVSLIVLLAIIFGIYSLVRSLISRSRGTNSKFSSSYAKKKK
jgi:hypothetical protein